MDCQKKKKNNNKIKICLEDTNLNRVQINLP